MGISKKLSVSIDSDLIASVDKLVFDKMFRSRSHAVDVLTEIGLKKWSKNGTNKK